MVGMVLVLSSPCGAFLGSGVVVVVAAGRIVAVSCGERGHNLQLVPETCRDGRIGSRVVHLQEFLRCRAFPAGETASEIGILGIS